MVSGSELPLKTFRTDPDEKNEVYEVVYTAGSEADTYQRTVRRLRLITRPIEVDAQVKGMPHVSAYIQATSLKEMVEYQLGDGGSGLDELKVGFLRCILKGSLPGMLGPGAVGLERGVSMVSQEDFYIDDPLGEEADVTGEDKMIERIKASVGKSRSNAVNREMNSADRRQHGYNYNAGSMAKGRRSAGRNTYNRSPARNRQNRSPGRAYGRNSPSDASRWRGSDSRTNTPGRRRM